jgi:hypothetical protein
MSSSEFIALLAIKSPKDIVVGATDDIDAKKKLEHES